MRDRRLAVLGDGTTESIRYAQVVRQWSSNVVYLVPASSVARRHVIELTARGIEVVEADVSHVDVDGQDRLAGLLGSLGCRTTDDGWLEVTGQGQTSGPELWVAGNVTNPRAQVIIAAGEGSAAAMRQ